MKKLFLTFSLLLTTTVIYSQNRYATLSGINVFDATNLGANINVGIPLGKQFYVSPDISYFFDNHDYSALNYNLNIEYNIFHAGRFNLSSFVGIGGFHQFWKSSYTNSHNILWHPSHNSNFGETAANSKLTANGGLSGKLYLNETTFVDTQVKAFYFTSSNSLRIAALLGFGFTF